MAATVTLENESAFEAKSLGIQVVLFVVTLGLYSLYWLYSTAKQLDEGTGESLSPILAVIPLVNIIAVWQISNAAEAITDQGKLLLFVLFIFLPIVPWYLIQSGMNDVAGG